ncbi:hypothetical protein [Mesorhizobium sp.]|uniref:hypothetical protein n=1 Tax=Mesorhizobium sp. TaxID=1871066 RepID=UPI000FE45F27|nr:hypothetical protein [Mesorhizobium sp.]RWQ47093.1 MAG: hypothetical protein EOS83_28355 [Mesorhizobium sp.]
MPNFSYSQHNLFLALVKEASEVARRKGAMTELDALLGLQITVATVATAIVGSAPAAASLRQLAADIEKVAREPTRLPEKNVVSEH